MKATRFMRQPFFVTGYKVEQDPTTGKDNMEVIARWCEGRVISDDEDRFIRVPVNRATNVKQTQARIGMWVLMSFTEHGDKSFKVYTEEWLEKQFVKVSDGAMNDVAARLFSEDEIQDDNDAEDETPIEPNRIASNLRVLPSQADPRTMNFRPAR